jgi:hypothetical protein
MSAQQASGSPLPRGRLRGLWSLFTSRRQARRNLSVLGIKKSRAADAPVWLLVGFLAASAAGAVIAAFRADVSGEIAVGFAAAGLTLAGLLVAVLQWRAGLAEKAFDALYQRIALANEMWLKSHEALTKAEDGDDAERKQANELYRFFVFTEIDSLEYAIRRYRFGMGMNEDIANRAVRHFRDRCERQPDFLELAATCAAEGAYFDETKGTVGRIVDESRVAVEARNAA